MKPRPPFDAEDAERIKARLAHIQTLTAEAYTKRDAMRRLDDLQQVATALLEVAEWLAQWEDGSSAFQCDSFHLEAAEVLDQVAQALGVWPKMCQGCGGTGGPSKNCAGCNGTGQSR